MAPLILQFPVPGFQFLFSSFYFPLSNFIFLSNLFTYLACGIINSALRKIASLV